MSLANRRHDKARLPAPARSAERGRFALASAANVTTPSQIGYGNPNPLPNFPLIFGLWALDDYRRPAGLEIARWKGVCGFAGANGAPPRHGNPHPLNQPAKLWRNQHLRCWGDMRGVRHRNESALIVVRPHRKRWLLACPGSTVLLRIST